MLLVNIYFRRVYFSINDRPRLLTIYRSYCFKFMISGQTLVPVINITWLRTHSKKTLTRCRAWIQGPRIEGPGFEDQDTRAGGVRAWMGATIWDPGFRGRKIGRLVMRGNG